MISLGIIAILASIAIPSIASVSASLTARNLDSAAEELFLYAQNNLTHIEANGSLSELEDSLKYTESPRGTRSYLICGDSFGLLPSDLIAECGGKSALAEIDIIRGDVLAVFYSEKLDPYELEELYLSLTDTDAAALRKLSVGYYGLDAPSTLLPARLCEPNISVINREDLWLEIVFNDIPEASAEEYKVNIEFSGTLGSVERTAQYLFIEGKSLKAYYLADSMTEDGGSLYAESLAPIIGIEDKISARAELYLNGRLLTSQRASKANAVSFSPLFEDSNNGCIKISELRHLSNLRQLSGSLNIVQTADIGFDGKFRSSDEFFPFSSGSSSASITPIPAFYGRYDGTDHFIQGLQIECENGYAGLFALCDAQIENIHIISPESGVSYVTASGNTSAMGAICGFAGENCRFVNCSVAGVSIIYSGNAPQISAGGIAGIMKGSALRCSSYADITVSDGTDASVSVGGIAGRLDGGSIVNSHSAGKLVSNSSGGGTVCGIAAGNAGSIVRCYSECSTGFICGAEYFGICPDEITEEGSFFVIENAWLDRNSSGDITLKELGETVISGFAGTAAFRDGAVKLPESVSVNGTPERFENSGLSEPRGLIGALCVKYSDGGFESDLLCCFDAYENEPVFFPNIVWDSPSDGETKYFFFRSRHSSDDWSLESGGEPVAVSDEFASGRFICQEILGITGGEILTLRFKDAVRNAEIPANELLAGALAIIHRSEKTVVGPETNWIPQMQPESYDYYYCYISSSDGVPKFYRSHPRKEFEELIFGSSTDGDIRIYAFAEKPVGDGWSFLQDSYDSTPKEMEIIDGIYYYELLSEPYFAEFSVEIICGKSSAKISFIRGFDASFGTMVTIIAE